MRRFAAPEIAYAKYGENDALKSRNLTEILPVRGDAHLTADAETVRHAPKGFYLDMHSRIMCRQRGHP